MHGSFTVTHDATRHTEAREKDADGNLLHDRGRGRPVQPELSVTIAASPMEEALARRGVKVVDPSGHQYARLDVYSAAPAWPCRFDRAWVRKGRSKVDHPLKGQKRYAGVEAT